jgi:hypothetical protein
MNPILQMSRLHTVSNGRISRASSQAQTRIRRPTSGSIPYPPWVWIGVHKVTISGTWERYIWIYVDLGTAEYKAITQNSAPQNVVIVDQYYIEIIVPRLG